VTITLSGGDVTNVLAFTDDAGRFMFRNLPSGRYTLSLSRPGYVSTAYGATKPGRGGVIAGTLTDLNGEPSLGEGWPPCRS